MKTITKITTIANIDTTKEEIQFNHLDQNHQTHYNDLKKHYESVGKFPQTPVINKNNEGLNCSFIVKICEELGVKEIEVEVVDNDKILNELYSINFRLINLKLSNIENSRLRTRQVHLYSKLEEKGITKTVSKENKVTQKTIQTAIRIDSIEEPLKKEIEEKHENIGVRELLETSDYSKEEQGQIKKELEENSSKGVKINNKGYKIILDKIKKKSILDNVKNEDNDASKVKLETKPKVTTKEVHKSRDIFKETIKLLIDSNQQIQKGQKSNDTKVFNIEFLKIQNHFNEVETYLSKSSNNTEFEEEKKVS